MTCGRILAELLHVVPAEACRELLVGRALCGGLLFMTAALDTLSAAAGFWLAALAFGGAL